MRMQGNTILVAGGAVGIGRGLAELLHRLGNEVIVLGDPASGGTPGIRGVDLDLGDPFAVSDFCERLASTCPGLNMLVDIAIAFPLSHLPGLQALLQADDSPQQFEARRLGMQQLTGLLLQRFRRQTCNSIIKVGVGPLYGPLHAPRAAPARPAIEGARTCVMSVRKRWVSACIEVVDIAYPSWADSRSPEALPRTQLLASLAHLLAEGLQEGAAQTRLRALWPAPVPPTRRTRDDLSEVH